MYALTETCGRIILNEEMWDDVNLLPLLSLSLTNAYETKTHNGTEWLVDRLTCFKWMWVFGNKKTFMQLNCESFIVGPH
jgi:hypothetical protein